MFYAVGKHDLGIGHFHTKDTPIILHEMPFQEFNTRYVPSKIGGHYLINATHWLSDDPASAMALAYAIGARHPYDKAEIPLASTLDETWQVTAITSATHHHHCVLCISDPRRSRANPDRHWYAPVIATQLSLSPDHTGLIMLGVQWLSAEMLYNGGLTLRDLTKLFHGMPHLARSHGPKASLALFAHSTDTVPVLDNKLFFLDWHIAVRFDASRITEHVRGASGLYRGSPTITVSFHLLGIVREATQLRGADKSLRLLLHLPYGTSGCFIIEVTDLTLSEHYTKTNKETGLLETMLVVKSAAQTSALTIYKAAHING